MINSKLSTTTEKTPKQQQMLRLRCSVKNYDWGVKGPHSKAARLYAAKSGLDIDPEKPYAEFWMGTHESGPSFIVPENENDNGNNGVVKSSGDQDIVVTLKDWIQSNPSVVGDKVAKHWGSDLPFLVKVLSVKKALSIQAHPDKSLARFLHKLHPNLYKDANHKPEMALAISEFEALCGFTSLEELKEVLKSVPEIIEIVGSANANNLLELETQDDEEKIKSVLRSIFTQLMSASKEIITKEVNKLKVRLCIVSKVRQLTDKECLALRLEEQYRADVGVISAFFLNYVKLNPGEALYLGANEPHAYLSGDCIECMATSDNVVRAGLTSKHRDVKTLCSMLTYKQGYPEILNGIPLNPYIKKYLPPFDEFEVDKCILPEGAATLFPAVAGPSIFLVMLGRATLSTGTAAEFLIKEGDVLFAPAQTEVSVKTTSELQLYRAGVNSKFFSSSNTSTMCLI